MEPRIETPDWVKDAIFYQIFPDRFASSPRVRKPSGIEPWASPPSLHGFKGGDLIGVVERLDYLQDLGVTAIYFTPVFQSAANHRYHTHDYYQVDPILGGNAALRTLLDEAHARGMRVVLDGVFNHASRGFFQFNHILENGRASPYFDWFTVHDFPMRAYEPGHQYLGWENLAALPKFNTATEQVREFLWDVGRYWIDFGIDGWRLDVPNEIDDDAFWQEFRRRVKDGNPDAYIVGEIWEDARRWLKGDQYDAVMNYLFTKACASFFIRDFDYGVVAALGPHRITPTDARGFGEAINALVRLYHPDVTAVQLNLLDSHDTPRFLTLAKGDEAALRLATLFQMTYPGAPSIYYGDEIGFGMAVPAGRRPRYDTATDPDTRRAFPWDEHQWNGELLGFFKRCIALRKAHPALRRGAFIPLQAKGDLYVFGRRLGEETLVVALNNGEQPAPVDFYAGPHLPEGALLREVWSGANAGVENGRIRGGQVPARSGAVWQVQPNTPDS
ncbi:MAG TPA: glycoside hydrolase family 13 protein [Herpetosiphonaceae bacterium]|nr:glycoside hydrolase family 13 protein [Herpetosiphonaceae bacterium]